MKAVEVQSHSCLRDLKEVRSVFNAKTDTVYMINNDIHCRISEMEGSENDHEDSKTRKDKLMSKGSQENNQMQLFKDQVKILNREIQKSEMGLR